MMLEAIMAMFSLSFFSFWTSIPAGLAMGLSPVAVFLIAIISYVVGILVVLLPGERLRAWFLRRYHHRQAEKTQTSLIWRAWERYGMIGLGLLGPMTVGAQIGTALGLSLNMPPRKLLVWMTLGAIIWSLILTVFFALGLAGVEQVISS